MSRSKYIYLVMFGNTLLSAHTVKKEALQWVTRCGWDKSDLTFLRMPDGVSEGEIVDELNGKRYKRKDYVTLEGV